MNIQNAQKSVDQWIKDHGVRYFNELTNMAQLTEEVGEVAHELFQGVTESKVRSRVIKIKILVKN